MLANRDSVRGALQVAIVVALAAVSLEAARQLRPLSPAPGPSGQPAAPAAISGVVTDAITGRPVAGAIVTLGLVSAGTPARTMTDSHGRFVFREVVPSTDYTLGASRFGYAYTRYGSPAPGQGIGAADAVRIAVGADQWIDNLRIPLWRLGSIGGRVLDEFGEPVVGVTVRGFSTRMVAGRPQLVGGPFATTDDRGAYRLADLSPGRYVVSVLSVQSTVLATSAETPQTAAIGELDRSAAIFASRPGIGWPAVDVDGVHRLVVSNFPTPPPIDGQPQAYPAHHFPGVPTIASATPIEIAYGSSRDGIDVQLRPVSAVRVSGRLVGGATNFPPFLLRLMAPGTERLGFGSEAATTQVEPDGRFTFLNVPAGEYTLIAQTSVSDLSTVQPTVRMPEAPGFLRGPSNAGGTLPALGGLFFLTRNGPALPGWARMPVSIGSDTIEDLVVPLQPTVSIRGHVEFAAGTSPRRVLLTTQPADGDLSSGMMLVGPAGSDKNFGFEISGLGAGRFLLVTGDLQIISVVWDGRDAIDTGFDTSSGRDIENVVVTLIDSKVDLSGNVLGRQGPVVSTVIAFPTDRERWTNYGLRAARFATAQSGTDGAYRFDRLRQGEYFLVAVDGRHANAWMDPAFLEAVAPSAVRVSVQWGESRRQNLAFLELVGK